MIGFASGIDSLIFVPTVGVVIHRFVRRRAMVTGISLSGSSFGAVVFFPISKTLILNNVRCILMCYKLDSVTVWCSAPVTTVPIKHKMNALPIIGLAQALVLGCLIIASWTIPLMRMRPNF